MTCGNSWDSQNLDFTSPLGGHVTLAAISGYKGEMQQPKYGGVRGCCVLWCMYPFRHIIPPSERVWWHSCEVSASLSLQGRAENPQSCEGSSGSCQQMIRRSEGTERTQRSGAWWSIDCLGLCPSWPRKMWLSFQSWQRGKTHKNCLYSGGKTPNVCSPCISRK